MICSSGGARVIEIIDAMNIKKNSSANANAQFNENLGMYRTEIRKPIMLATRNDVLSGVTSDFGFFGTGIN